jgi:hypothetical protein
MKLKLRSTRKRLLLLIALAGLAAAGVAYAAIPDSQGVIHACYDKQAGQVRIVDTGPNAVPKGCGKNEVAISWNQTGPQGPAGPPGPPGPGTADAFAGITNDGTLDPDVSRGIAQANVTHPRPGVYCLGGLGFTPKVGFGTGWNGLSTDPSTGEILPAAFDTLVSVAVAPPGHTTGGAGCPPDNQVRIYTYRVSANALVDRTFYILLKS